MTAPFSRRRFLSTLLAGSAGLYAPRVLSGEGQKAEFSFVLLGDLHYDQLAHHDLAWLEKDKPDDLRQVRDYSRITSEIQPLLLATLRETIADLNRSSTTRVALVAQLGDFVEGLCGSEKLASQQNQDAINCIRDANLGAPFLFTKGNHDVTGPGAVEAFKTVFNPFLQRETARLGKSAVPGSGSMTCWSTRVGDTLFCFYDAYSRESLPWLESTLAHHESRHVFVLLHTPVVPYGARSTWHVFSAEKDQAQRERLLKVLGKNRTFVFTGHIHKYNLAARATPGDGRFVQMALSSVISTPDPSPRTILDGIKDYNADQIKVEPTFSPATEAQRRAVLEAEAPFVKAFEYADLPGYAVVQVAGHQVRARIYSGVTRKLWRDVDLMGMLAT